jgi:hypothetical protein
VQPRRTYVDTNVLKFSATELLRLRPRKQLVNWAGHVQEVIVHDLVTINRNDNIANPTLKREAELLPKLAAHGKAKRIHYVINAETEFESWGLRNMDSRSGKFYDTPLERVEAPVQYGRVIIGAGIDPELEQFRFLGSLKHPRFLELQKMTGAYQGPGKLNRNQLLDAFHLWCAEHNRCSFFLTLDFRLLKMLRRGKTQLSVQAVRPSELLAKVVKSES